MSSLAKITTTLNCLKAQVTALGARDTQMFDAITALEVSVAAPGAGGTIEADIDALQVDVDILQSQVTTFVTIVDLLAAFGPNALSAGTIITASNISAGGSISAGGNVNATGEVSATNVSAVSVEADTITSIGAISFDSGTVTTDGLGSMTLTQDITVNQLNATNGEISTYLNVGGTISSENCNASTLVANSSLTVGGTLQYGVFTIADLPNPGVPARAFVTDQDNAFLSFRESLTSTGAPATTPVFYDGIAWYVG